LKAFVGRKDDFSLFKTLFVVTRVEFETDSKSLSFPQMDSIFETALGILNMCSLHVTCPEDKKETLS